MSRAQAPPPGEPLLPPASRGPLRAFRARWHDASLRRRRIRPTRAGWLFLGSSFAVAVAALNTGNNLLYLVFAAQLALVALSGVLSELALQQLVVERRLPGVVLAGVPAAGGWRLHNPRRWLAHVALRVEEAPTPSAPMPLRAAATTLLLPAGGRADLAAPRVFPRRGLHRLEGVAVATAWPFGIFTKRYVVPLPQLVLVGPRPRDEAPDAASKEDERAEEGAVARGGDGDLRSLREHRPGDDPRSVHWRTSARRQRLVVVERGDPQRARRVVHVAPPGPGPEEAARFEEALRAAAGALVRAGAAGLAVELRLPDGSGRDAPAGQGEALVPALALLSARAGGSEVRPEGSP